MEDNNPDSLAYIGLESASPAQEFTPHEQALLDEVNQRVAGAESLADMIDFVFDKTSAISPTDRLSVAFIEDGDRVVSYYTHTSYEEVRLSAGFSEGLAGSSLQEVIDSGRPRIINDLAAYAAAHPGSRSTRLILDEGLLSSMTCPLAVEERNVGLLWRSSRKPNAYDEHQVRLHQAIASRLGQAVEKAWRIEQQTAATRAYSEMLGFVSHELKSPIGSIMTDINLVLGEYLGPVDPKQKQKLEGSLRKGDFLMGLIKEYLDLARIESGELSGKFEPVEMVKEVIEPAIELVAAQLEDRGQKLLREWPENLPTIHCDSDLLKIVAVNFIGNASKYGDTDGTIRISARIESDNLRFEVWNSGPGFPPEQRGKLFRRFSRVDTPELKKRKGTGVGLYSSARIIALYKGRVGADSEPGSWASFWFEIPSTTAAT